MANPFDVDTTGSYPAYVAGFNDAAAGKAPTRPPSRLRVFLFQFGALVRWTMTSVAFIGACVVVIAQFDSTPPMRIIKSDTHVFTAPDGKSFFVNRTTCMDRMVPADGLPNLKGVSTQLLIPLPKKPLSASLGCADYRILVLIPEEVPAGEYFYKITYRFKMNPFRTLEVEAPTVNITVTR
jgi:hypothetical protein